MGGEVNNMKITRLNGQVINIGEWDYVVTETGEITNPLPVGAVVTEEDYTPVPVSVTPLQMRRALRATGLKATVDAALAAQSEEVREEWEFASEVRRDNATLNALGNDLGKSPADLDSLFQLAATL